MRETRIIGGFEVREPMSVMSLNKIRELIEADTPKEKLLKELDGEIEHRWVVDGFWANVQLEQVWD